MFGINTLYGWWERRRVPQIATPEQTAQAESREPAQGDATGDQNVFVTGSGYGGGEFEGFGETPIFLPEHADICRQTASLILARSAVIAAVLAGTWQVEQDEKKAPKGAKDLIEQRFLPHRDALLEHGLGDGLDLGCAMFAPIYGARDGLVAPDWFKPLNWHRTEIWRNPDGTLAGFKTTGADGAAALAPLWGANAMLYTYGSTVDLYGRGRLRGLWRYVWRQRMIEERIAQLSGKALGMVPEITYTPGVSKDPRSGVETDNKDLAARYGQKLTSSYAGYLLVQNALSILTPQQRMAATPKELLELVDSRLSGVDLKDLGDQSGAITALQAVSAYYDVCINRAYHQPERALQEGTHGTKGEAGVHTDTGTADNDFLHRSFVTALNRQAVDDTLEANWGAAVRGTVKIVAPSLKDTQESSDNAVIQSLLTNTMTAKWVAENFEVNEVFKRRGIGERLTPIVIEDATPATPPAAGKEPPDEKPAVKLAASRDANDAAFERLLDGFWGTPVLAASNGGDDGDGHWVTMEGEHVFIKGGVIAKGPAKLVGKKPDDLPARSAPKEKIGKKESEYDKTAEAMKPDEKVYAGAVQPPHEVVDREKFDQLVNAMEEGGWKGRPVLVEPYGDGYQALTGSHRVAAARKAGIDIPIIHIDKDKLGKFLRKHDAEGETFTHLMRVGDDEDRLSALRKLGDKRAAALMAEEIRANHAADEAGVLA